MQYARGKNKHIGFIICISFLLIFSVSPNISLGQTMFNQGDCAVIGWNININSCTGNNEDLVYIICFDDIDIGTSFFVTDNGYINATSSFETGEGFYEFVSNVNISANTVFQWVFPAAFGGIGPANPDWTISDLSGLNWVINIAGGGDQLIIGQGNIATFFPGTANNTNDAIYTGTIITAINTTNDWTYAGNNNTSDLPPGTENGCYSLQTDTPNEDFFAFDINAIGGFSDCFLNTTDATIWQDFTDCADFISNVSFNVGDVISCEAAMITDACNTNDGSIQINNLPPGCTVSLFNSSGVPDITNPQIESLGTVDFVGLTADTYTYQINCGGGGMMSQNIWDENFENGINGWNLNVPSGVNGTLPNTWVINDGEGGVTPGGCGLGGNNNETLHITFSSGLGAIYFANSLSETNMEAQSPIISTINATNLILEFAFIANGQPSFDFAEVFYDCGAGPVSLGSLQSNICPSTQGEWALFSAPLPAICNNNSNVQIFFNWTNNADNIGTDPSVAINDVVIFGDLPAANACTYIRTVVVNPPVVVPNYTPTDEMTCAANDGSLIVEAIEDCTVDLFDSTGNPFASLVANSSNQVNFTNLPVDDYTFVVSCGGTCASASSPSITIATACSPCDLPADPMIEVCTGANAAPTFNLTQFNQDVINGSTTSTIVTWYYGDPSTTGTQITNPTMADITNLPIYAQLSDGASCFEYVQVTFQAPTTPPVSVVHTSNPETCDGENDGSIDITVSGGGGLFIQIPAIEDGYTDDFNTNTVSNISDPNNLIVYPSVYGFETGHTYLKFDVTPLAGLNLNQAYFITDILYDGFANGGSETTDIYFVSNDSWSETTLNWNNQPATVGPKIGDWRLWCNGIGCCHILYDNITSCPANPSVEVVATNINFTNTLATEVAGDGILSLSLQAFGYETWYPSKENTGYNSFRIEIDCLEYSWTGPNGYTSSDEDISNLEPGDYTLTITDICTGCIYDDWLPWTVVAGNILTPPDLTYCNLPGTSPNPADFDLTQLDNSVYNALGYNITWYDGDPSLMATNQITPATNVNLNNYTQIWAQASNGTTTCTVQAIIDTDGYFDVTVNSATPTDCSDSNNGAIDVTITNLGDPSCTYTTQWTSLNGYNNTTDEDINGLAADTYTLTVTGNCAGTLCPVSYDISVGNDNSVPIATTPAPVSLCETAPGSGMYEIDFTDPTLLSDITGGDMSLTVQFYTDLAATNQITTSTYIFDPLFTTIYATVLDGAMCESTAVVIPINQISQQMAISTIIVACETTVGSGFADFDLSIANTQLWNDINGGSGLPVNFYSDMAATMPITSPYNSDGTNDIYATIGTAPCVSAVVSIDLLVSSLPQVSSTLNNTNICINDDATISFTGTPGATVFITDDVSNVQTPVLLDATGMGSISYTVSQNFNITVDLVSLNDCDENIGQIFNITAVNSPTASSIPPQVVCDNDGDGSESFALSTLEADILNSQTGVDVTWFSDATLMVAYSSPTISVNVNNTQSLWAVVDNGTCSSAEVMVDFTVVAQPVTTTNLGVECAGGIALLALSPDIGGTWNIIESAITPATATNYTLNFAGNAIQADLTNATTGFIYFDATFTSDNGCIVSVTIPLEVSLQSDASFTLDNFCGTTSNPAIITGTNGGDFSFNPLPGDGASINTATGVITNAVAGTIYNVVYTVIDIDCGNAISPSLPVTASAGPAEIPILYDCGSDNADNVCQPGFNEMFDLTTLNEILDPGLNLTIDWLWADPGNGGMLTPFAIPPIVDLTNDDILNNIWFDISGCQGQVAVMDFFVFPDNANFSFQACGSFTLPNEGETVNWIDSNGNQQSGILGSNSGAASIVYYENQNLTGNPYSPGDVILPSDNIDIIYVYASYGNCCDGDQITVDVDEDPDLTVGFEDHCGSFTLLDPLTNYVNNYDPSEATDWVVTYTDDVTGIQYFVGDLITSDITLSMEITNGACPTITEPLVIDIFQTPSIDNTATYQGCINETGIVIQPPITLGDATSISTYTWSLVSGAVGNFTNLNDGSILVDAGTTAGTVIFDFTIEGNNTCTATEQITLNINAEDDVSFDYPANVCYDATSSVAPTTMPMVANGTFSIDNSATINGTTGEIDLSTVNQGQSYTVTYTVNAGSTTCGGTATDVITIYELPIVSNISADCSNNATDYVVTFEISTNDPNGISVSPIGTFNSATGLFTSNPITVDATVTSNTFVITDGNNCSFNQVVTVPASCACVTAVGSLTTNVASACGINGTINLLYDTSNEMLDGDDITEYWLIADDTNVTGSLLTQLTNSPPSITFNAGLTYGTTYYVTAITGSNVGGTVDLNDLCLSIAQPIPIVFYEEPTATISGGGSICNDGSQSLDVTFNLTGTGPWTIVYNNGVNNFTEITGNNPFNLPVVVGGNYTVVSVEDANCFSTNVSGNAMIDITNSPTANAGLDTDYICGISSLQLDGSASTSGNGITYQWTASNGGTLQSGIATATPVVLSGGTYTLTVCDGPTCCATDDVIITPSTDLPDVNAGLDMQLDCVATQVTLNGSSTTIGNLQYNWTSTFGGNFVSGQTTANPIVDGTATYTLTVTNLDNNCSNSDDVVVTSSDDVPFVEAGANLEIDCNNNTVNLQGFTSTTGNLSYLWTTTDGNIVSGETTLTALVDAAGTYTLTITDDDNNCFAFDSMIVTEDLSAGNAGTNTLVPPACVDFSNTFDLLALMDGNPDSGGAWSPTLASGNNQFNPAIDASGIYTYTLGSGACLTSATIDIQVFQQPEISLIIPLYCDQLDLNTIGYTENSGGGIDGQISIWDGDPFAGGFNITSQVTTTDGTYWFLFEANNPSICAVVDNFNLSFIQIPDAGENAILNICDNNAILNLFDELNGTPDTGGIWYDPNGMTTSSTFNPATSLQGIYTYEFWVGDECPIVSATVSVNVDEQISAIIGSPICDVNNENYTINITVTANDLNTVTWTGTNGTYDATTGIITSDPIPSGNPYSFSINNGSVCSSIDFNSSFSCNCATFAGSISPASVNLCFDPTDITTTLGFVYDNSTEVLDANDGVIYLVHNDINNPLSTWFLANTILDDILFSATFTYGQTYYITAVAANILSDGSIDFNDACLSTSQPVAFTLFDEPTATLSGGGTICSNSTTPATIEISFTGSGPWDVVYSINATETILNAVTVNPLSIDMFMEGTITLVSVESNTCTGTVNGSASIIINDLPQLTNTNLTACSDDGVNGNFNLTDLDTGNVNGWYIDSDLSISVSYPNNLTATDATIIYAELFDSTTGCSNTVPVTLSVSNLETILSNTDDISCSGLNDGAATILNLSSDCEITITDPSGNDSVYTPDVNGEIILNNLFEGNYSIFSNCDGAINTCNGAGTFIINEPQIIDAPMLSNFEVCGAETVTIESGGSNLIVFNDAALTDIYNSGVSINIDPLPNAGNSVDFWVVISDNPNCQSDATMITVGVTDNFEETLTPSICTGASYEMPDGSFETIENTYTYNFVTDAGCDSTIIVELSVDESTAADITFSDIICADSETGTATIIAAAEGCVITLTDSDGIIQTFTAPADGIVELEDLAANSYSVSIDCTDAGIDDCIAEGNFEILEGTSVNAPGVSNIIACAGENIVITPTGNNNNFNFYCDPDFAILIGAGNSFDTIIPVDTTLVWWITQLDDLGCESAGIPVTISIGEDSNETINATICTGGNYPLPDGTFATTAGTYDFFDESIFGCDSNTQIIIEVDDAFEINNLQNICEGESYTLPDGNTTVDQSGTYETILTSTFNCDSIVTTFLNVNPQYDLVDTIQICSNGEATLPDGTTVTAPGDYVSNLNTTENCDSIITTTVIIEDIISIEENASICAGSTYTLPDQTIVDQAGTYTSSFITTAGCDSIVTTILAVNNEINEEILASICSNEMYTLPDGSTVSDAGVYSLTFTTAENCDSTISTTVVVFESYNIISEVSICTGASYELPDGTIVSTAGQYQVDALTLAGCDSLVSIDLTIEDAFMVNNPVELCEGENYLLPDGITLVDEAGSYETTIDSSIDCDSIITTNVTIIVDEIIDDVANICEGEMYELPDGSFVSTAGYYTVSIDDPQACTTTYNIDLTISSSYEADITETFCAATEYELPNGDIVNSTGTYEMIYSSIDNCDSIINFTIDTYILYDVATTVAICTGGTYQLPDGTIVDSAGDYLTNTPAIDGCDSIVLTTITVDSAFEVDNPIEFCGDNFSYELPDGTNVTMAGTYETIIPSTVGCDSIITTFINQNDIYNIEVNATICEGDTYTLPDNSQVTTADTYITSFLSTENCDSIITTILAVTTEINVNETATICDGNNYEMPDGSYENTEGIYTYQFTTASNCDSIITVDLSVESIIEINESASICEGEIFTLPDGTEAAGTGIYEVIISTPNSCDSLITTNLTVNALDDASFSYSTSSYCSNADNASPDYIAEPGGIFTVNGSYSINANTGEIDFSNTSIGDVIVVTYTTDSNCSNESVFEINITNSDDATISYQNSYCIDGTNPLPLNVVTTGGTFSADNGLGINATTGLIDLSTGTVGSSYTISYETSGSCTASYSTNITITDVDDASFFYNQHTFCPGDENPVVLSISTLGGIFSIDGGLNIDPVSGQVDIASGIAGQNYTITYSTIGECSSSHTEQISLHNIPNLNLELAEEICAGTELDVALLSDQTMPENAEYFWNFDGATIMNGSNEGPYQIIWDQPGMHEIELQVDGLDCPVDQVTGSIFVSDLSVITIDDITVLAGEQIVLNSSAFSNNELIYNWSPAASLNCTNCESPVASPTETTTYTLSVIDEVTGCEARTFVTIEVEIIEPYVPNIFTPNSDGLNDNFKPLGTESIIEMEFWVYNRWGELMFYSDNEDDGWKGDFKNLAQNSGVYVWLFHYTLSDGSEGKQKGNVTLVR